MRILLLTLLLAVSGAAHAEECKLPEGKNEALRGVIDFSECIQSRVNALETENAALRESLAAMQKTLGSVPGELVNVNGRETRSGGERLTQASYTMPSRAGTGAAFLAVDDKVASDLCAQGCAMSLQMTSDSGIVPPEPGAIGPCTFRYSAKSGAWSLTGCGEPVSGIDGNGKPTGAGGGEQIAVAGGACILADAEPRRDVDTQAPKATEALGRDRGKALYLIADSRLAAAGTGRFRCDLMLVR